jgi:predicted nucleic acid-binding protein
MNRQFPRYLLDTPTARTLLQADAPDGLRLRVRTTRLGCIWVSALTEAVLRHQVNDPAAHPGLGAAVDLLLRNLPTVPFDQAAATACGLLARLTTDLDAQDPELLTAALAISTESILVTADRRLTAIPGLPTENWLSD